jgi:acetoin utilization deacetylase AcuC-like enzyme
VNQLLEASADLGALAITTGGELLVKIVYGSAHRGHAGAMELMLNRLVPMFETPERMDRILARLKECSYQEILEPQSFALDPIYRIHDRRFVEFLPVGSREMGEGSRRRPLRHRHHARKIWRAATAI